MSYTVTGVRSHGFHRSQAAGTVRRIARAVRTGLRAARILATSNELPRTLRILFVIGLVQVPFCPLDEICLAIALDRKSTRLNSSHSGESRMPSSA